MTFRAFFCAAFLAAASLAAACGSGTASQHENTAAPAPSTTAPPSSAPAQEPEHRTHAQDDPPHKFSDAKKWAKVFDDPKRDAWQKPNDVVRELGLKPDDVVADLGAGTGYFTVRLASAVPKGKVIGIDLEQSLLDHIRERARQKSLTNIETILATPDDPKLPKGVDVLLVVDTYHHISDRVAYFKRVLDRLDTGGRVVIVDYKMGKLPVGPPDGHKIPRSAIDREMSRAGYAMCRAWDGLPYQHVLFYAREC
jgi:ubiquinone/menaquinone biosynthesis C-methylase UbiE